MANKKDIVKETKEAAKAVAAAGKEVAKDVAKKATKTAKKTATAAKKTATAAKKTATAAAKKLAVSKAAFVQYSGLEFNTEDIFNKAEAQFVADGHEANEIKDIKIYIKPAEFTAYYVINGDICGKVEL